MTTTINSVSLSSHGSIHNAGVPLTKRYLLLRDTVAKSRWTHGGSTRSRLLSKRSEQRVLKGSLWQEIEGNIYNPGGYPPPQSARSISRTSSITSPSSTGHTPQFKRNVESIEIEDLTLQCASAFLAELTDDICSLLLAIPTSEERFYVYSDSDRINHAKFINVGSDVIVSKRNFQPCRATVKWKGRLVGKQGVWFGVEIVDEQNIGCGDSDGSVNTIRLFNCDKNNGMFVNIAHITLVPPKRPQRRQKKKAPSTPSQGSERNIGNSSQQSSEPYLNDLVSQTESELSFMDDVTSAETVPLVNLKENDRVAWPSDVGYEKAFVRWVGTLPEEGLHGEILVGVEFDNPIGKGTGVYKNQRLFEAKRGHASLVPLDGLIKISSSSSSLRNASETSSRQSLLLHHGRHDGDTSPQIISAGDVFESLGINDSDHESSDVNNNTNGRTSRDIISPSPPIRSSIPPPLDATLTNDSNGDNFSAYKVRPLPASGHAPHLNGSVKLDTSSRTSLSSSDNLHVADSFSDAPLPPSPLTNHVRDSLTSTAITFAAPTIERLPLSGPSNDPNRVQNNGWSDSEDSLPDNQQPSKSSDTKATKSENSKLTSYRIPKSYSGKRSFISHKHCRNKNKNGLLALHSLELDARDMHEIVDELSLNSSPGASNISLSDNQSYQQECVNGADTNMDTIDSDRLILGRQNAIAASSTLEQSELIVSSQSKNGSHSSDNRMSTSSSQSSSEEGSYSAGADGELSPLSERTTPVSHSSLDNQTESSMLNSDITIIPAPLLDSNVFGGSEDLPLYEVPDPPPEFMGNETNITDCSAHTGLWKGIAGSQAISSNTGFMEAVLFILSVSTDVFGNLEDFDSPYSTIKSFLLQRIALPLRDGQFVDSSVMTYWRQQLNEISTGQFLLSGSMRELQKFLTLLLQHICNMHPLYELNNNQSGYAMTLVSYKDARVGFPTVQKLLEKTCIQQQIKLNQVPNNLILILPRWSLNRERIFPNLHIDLTDVLEYAKRICHMCGEQAVFECPECYEQESAELSSAAFCQPCSQTVHKHSKRLQHMPVELKIVTQLGDEESSILILKGVLCVRDEHYVSLSYPPCQSGGGKDRPSSTMQDSDWLYFDSKAASNDSESTGEEKTYVPEVSAVPEISNWLSMEAYDHMARDMDSIPENIRRLLEDCCLCLYSKS